MANMPGSGTLYFSQLRDVFGPAGTIYMSRYYRGGGYVPNHQLNINVPTAGTIYMSNFYNATNVNGVFANVSKGQVDLYRSNNGLLSDSVACTATGGDGNYSWSYAWLSGGTSITLTAVGGGFSVSSTASGSINRYGVVRATVTSSVFSDYKDVYVNMQWGQPV